MSGGGADPGRRARQQDRRATLRALSLFAAGCLIVGFLSLWLGTFRLTPAETLGLLLGKGGDPLARHAVIELRLPRAALALGVGAALALAGAILQGVLRNPLVEPGVIGLNAGAALAAAIVLVAGTGFVPPVRLAVAASIGAAGALALVIGLAWSPQRTARVRLILAGIAVSALGGAALSAISLVGPPQRLQRLLVWMSGDLSGSTMAEAALIWTAVAGILPVALAAARALDLRGLDTLSSAGLGNRRPAADYGLLAIAAILAGIATSVAGIIVFVGLVAPHLARRLVGPLHGRLLPVSALLGALLVATADLAGRILLAPTQLPAGLIAALIGTPYFFYLMRRSHG